MEIYILDANLFFNMEAGLNLGKNTKETVINLIDIGQKLKKNSSAQFMMPPRVVDEFLGFFNDKDEPFIQEFLSLITVKSPDITKINIAATVFYQLIEDIRGRSYRGLNIGEEEIEKAGQLMMGNKDLDKKKFQIKIGEVIKKFRERYRNATRVGFLDSVADLDLIILAKEQNGFLVSADAGVNKWGRVFGVKEMPGSAWKKQLTSLLDYPPHRGQEKKSNQSFCR